MKLEVITTFYVWNTGHQPKGYGTWAFGNRQLEVHFLFQGYYADAKKAAIKEMGTNAGVKSIYVLP